MSELAERGVYVKPLEWMEDRRTDLYAEVPIGMNFSGYYTVSDTGAYDLWEVNFGVHCHEFGDTLIWKGTGRAAAVKAAEDHNESRILAALDIRALPAAPQGWEPPEDRADGYRCLGWADGAWHAVAWHSGWGWLGPEQVIEPTAFAPLPAPVKGE